MPCLIFLLCIIIDTVSISLCRENLDYIAYSSGRAAVVSTDYNSAYERVEEIMNKKGIDNLDFTLNVITKNNTPTDNWEKGQFIEITVSKEIKTLMKGSKKISSTLILMIERGGV